MDYISVTDLNEYIKSYLERDSFLRKIYLKGEISNLKKHGTGHWYFTLKDDGSRINAVMFKASTYNVNFTPEDGMNVLVEGRVSSFPSSGSYQVYAEKMQLDGIGNLHLEFEKLKKKLHQEGLFDQKYKKAIPKYPNKIGVITAQSGAAIKDIISTINRRFPVVEVILFPSLVQGMGATDDIVKQLKIADNYGLDTIIVGRGGGSIEDMWSFNEELVARAIFECKTPIISAVGHEIDVTIADYVADLRAPTPTGAAEMAVPTVIDTVNTIEQYKIRLNKSVKNMVNNKFIVLRNLKQSYILKNPMSMYEIKMQKLDNLIESANSKINNIVSTKTEQFNQVNTSYILNNPEKIVDNQKNKLAIVLANLKNLNPLGILEKGYSVISLDDSILTSQNNVKVGDEIDIRLLDGYLKAEIIEKKEGK
ncbi:MAG: exodeoxyribonuclease VII large subunit [bacterium]